MSSSTVEDDLSSWSDGRKEVRGSPRPKSSYSPEGWRALSAKERDVIIRRGQLEAEAEKLKELKLKKEKEKKAKAKAAEKKKSEASSHKVPPDDESKKKRRKKSNKDPKESSSKDGGKDAAAGVGTLRGEWVSIPATTSRGCRTIPEILASGYALLRLATLMTSSTSRSQRDLSNGTQ